MPSDLSSGFPGGGATGGWAHLARRFFQSLAKRPPDPVEEAWLLGLLNSSEILLYQQMSQPDRRHAVCSARGAALINDEQRVAAALHDVGKTAAGLGTMARVGATLVSFVARGRVGGRWACYLDHPRLGAAMLKKAGSSELAVTWAAEHHLRLAQCSLSPDVAAALATAD